ncbi:MAG TPA: FkbM family methyltransferase [Rhabdochlamydiaceae bacterium]|nr:FkbM family methyltransferase [Rhabdochlamydiaceae bacterium]
MKKLFFALFFFVQAIPALQADYYSQFAQDQFVHETFFPVKHDGIFVDIGAYDGVSMSNSYFFEKELGWKGICIEPNPQVFDKLQKLRKAVCVQACISDKKETAKFLRISGRSEMLSGLSDKYDPKHLKRIDSEIANFGGEKLEIEVPTVTLNELADQEGIRRVDFLSIDTEGGEFDILKSIDFTKLDVDVIAVENNYHDPNFRQYLQSHGFVFITKLECDEIYKKTRLEKFSGAKRPSLYYIKQFLPVDPVIVEAGAHEGSDTVKLSRFWKGGKVFAFEPSPDVYTTLRKRVAKRKNVKTCSVALGDKVGTAKFFPSQKASEVNIKCNAQGSLLPPSEKNWSWPQIGFGKPILVRVTTLDAWAKNEKIEKVDFLWLDMQGFELAMLKASPEILKTVKVIQIEVSKKAFYENTPLADEVQSWLEAQGFSMVYMTPEEHGDAFFVRPN